MSMIRSRDTAEGPPLTCSDLTDELGEDLARWLIGHATHTDYAGEPVLERERARELLDLYQYTV